MRHNLAYVVVFACCISSYPWAALQAVRVQPRQHPGEHLHPLLLRPSHAAATTTRTLQSSGGAAVAAAAAGVPGAVATDGGRDDMDRARFACEAAPNERADQRESGGGGESCCKASAKGPRAGLARVWGNAMCSPRCAVLAMPRTTDLSSRHHCSIQHYCCCWGKRLIARACLLLWCGCGCGCGC